jgi:HD-like signal output (HDOD) protein
MHVAEVFEKTSGKLPMIPKVVQELVHSINQSDIINIDDIANTLGHDQVLTARVLRLANTARFGGSRRVGSIDDALLVLGFDTLRVLVIASGITGATASIPNFNLRAFWQRSFEIANTARDIARISHHNQQLAYTCGLLSRIGELVLHLAAPEHTEEIERLAQGLSTRNEIERNLLGVDSPQIGAELAWRWSFPENIVSAIGNQYPLDGKEGKPVQATIIGLALLLVIRFNAGEDADEILPDVPDAALEHIGLSREALAEALPDLQVVSTTVDELL